jgi:hypothetical protein
MAFTGLALINPCHPRLKPVKAFKSLYRQYKGILYPVGFYPMGFYPMGFYPMGFYPVGCLARLLNCFVWPLQGFTGLGLINPCHPRLKPVKAFKSC